MLFLFSSKKYEIHNYAVSVSHPKIATTQQTKQILTSQQTIEHILIAHVLHFAHLVIPRHSHLHNPFLLQNHVFERAAGAA